MKLLTKAIEKKIPALYAQEKTWPGEKTIYAKFFVPWNQWTWYAIEACAVLEDGTEVPFSDPRASERVDVLFFGYVRGHECEWGYWTLSQLESVQGPFGLKIERDRSFGPVQFGKCSEVEL